MSKKLLKLLYLAIGVALLVFVAGMVDIREVMVKSLQIGWGMWIIIALHFASFLADAFSWQMTLPGVPLNKVWLYRIWKVLLVGEALNMVLPAAGMGGEPIKAMLLKRRYSVGYGDGVASLILNQTIILISLLFFMMVGFVLALFSDKISARYDAVAIAGMLAIGLGCVIIFFLQHANLSSLVGRFAVWLGAGEKTQAVLLHIGGIEKKLVNFYASHHRRFAGSLVMAIIPWVIGVPEVYYASMFLGYPISFAEAWIIESSVQMVRAATPFIPAGLGAQEGTFVVLMTAITGSPTLGGAIAMVRRFRDIVWLVGGAIAGLAFFLTSAKTKADIS